MRAREKLLSPCFEYCGSQSWCVLLRMGLPWGHLRRDLSNPHANVMNEASPMRKIEISKTCTARKHVSRERPALHGWMDSVTRRFWKNFCERSGLEVSSDDGD